MEENKENNPGLARTKTPTSRPRQAAKKPPPAAGAMTDSQKAIQAQRDASRAEIQRQKEELRRRQAVSLPTTGGGSTILEDRSRWLTNNRPAARSSAPLVETRAFCVAEARRFGEEKLVCIRSCCKGAVFFQGHEKGKWPESSPYACWHCGYNFDGPPMGMPTRWDEKTDQFTLVGNFCTPSCCAGYIRHTQPYMRINYSIGGLERLLQKSLGISYTFIQEPPPRYVLERYGGWMSIEEYRNQGLYTTREMRRDEYVKEWIPQEVGITVWGRLILVKGVSAEDLKTAVDKKQPAAKRLRAAESGLESFISCKRTKL